MDASLMSRVKELELENARLKKMYAEVQLQADVLKEVLQKSNPAISWARNGQPRSQEWTYEHPLACDTFVISQTCYRYTAKLLTNNALIADWLVRLTQNRRNRGFGVCFLCLRNVKGFTWNHKQVYRIYRELELTLRIKPHKRLVR